MSDRTESKPGVLLETISLKAWTTDLLILIGAIAWIGFWGMIATLHYRQGDLLAAGLTGIGFTAVGLGILVWRLNRLR